VKKILCMLLAVGLMAAFSLASAEEMQMDKPAKAQKTTLKGTLVDVACYLEEGDTGNDHGGMKACGTECLKGGSPAGLLVDKKLYIIVFPAPAFMDYVGKEVEMSGELYGDTNFIPSKAAVVEKDGKKKNISLKGKAMM
jgi:hypothetical protein